MLYICMRAEKLLARVEQSKGDILMRLEYVVGSPRFDEKMRELDPTAISHSGGNTIFGVPYAVSSDIASGLARCNFMKRERNR